MPNDVYSLARRELAAVVSTRAAERVLDDALAFADVSADDVTPRQMRALVTGPIHADLRAILPHAGLRRALHGLTERLREIPPPTTGSGADAASRLEPANAPTREREDDAASGAPPDASTPDAEASGGAPPASGLPGPAEAATAVAPPPATAADEPASPHPPRRVPAPLLDADLDQDALERLALVFARLEDVVGVAIVREGRVRFARGAGFDPERAAVMVPVAAGVMGRHGAWRSYTLVHDRGQMFIVPVGRDHLVVAGRPEFNLGATLAALASLEEAL